MGVLAALLIGVVAAVGLIGSAGTEPAPAGETIDLPSAPSDSPPPASRQPNIVLVQLDDFSMDLLPAMATAAEMAERGVSFSHSFVVDSLCCVSRSSTFTGQYPHQTGVLTNSGKTAFPDGPIGGWPAFEAYGNEERTVARNLQAAGYTTGYVGKYLNEFEYHPGSGELPSPPAGWDDLRVIFGGAYAGWDFWGTYVEDGEMGVREYPAPDEAASPEEKDEAYAGTVIAREAVDFIRDQAGGDAPYFLQVAPYAPHSYVSGPHYGGDPLFPPAFADRPRPGDPDGNCGPVACTDLGVEDLPGYGDDRSDNAPVRPDGSVAEQWGEPKALDERGAESGMRNRARMLQSVDRMLAEILDLVDEHTYVVLTSDNGFHLGQFGRLRGKGTAYDADTRVPLIVVGPDVEPGTRHDLVTNLDLAPTFEELAGARTPAYRAGRSLVPALRDEERRVGEYVFFEHTWSQTSPTDPDAPFTGGSLDSTPSYVAVRSRDALLVRNDMDPSLDGVDHAFELYDLEADPAANVNVYADPAHAALADRLTRKLVELDGCAQVRADQAVPRRCRALSLR